MSGSSPNSARGLQRYAPHLAAFLARPNDALDLAVFLAAVGEGGTFAIYGGWRGAGGILLSLLTAAQIALFVWTLAAAIRLATLRAVDALAYPVAASLVLASLFADRLYFAFFREHLSVTALRQAVVAFRAGALRVEPGTFAAAIAGALVVALVLALALKGLARIPRPPRLTAFVAHAALPALLVVGSGASVRDCAAGPGSLQPARRTVPWDGASASVDSALTAAPAPDRDAMLFGDQLPFDEAQRHGEALLAGPIEARARPDILVIHVESLRADMVRPDVAPTLAALTGEGGAAGAGCFTTPFHYTTGTNTGTGVFGILDGMTAQYFPLLRDARAQPLPLRVLGKLGYEISLFFSNNFRVYDGLFDLFFQGLAGYVYDGPGEPIWQADAKMIAAWRTRLAARTDERPRFDYVILDSTHYDYSYPPELERFTPAMTLDLGARDALVAEEGINERLKWRGPFVRNRYQNSVLYADSLIAQMLGALRDAGRLDRTIVVVTGDHGEEFWEHGAFGHGFFSLSNEQSRVPFVMCIPGDPRAPAGTKTTSRYRYSSHADVFPTIFDAMGLAPDTLPFMNGKSLLRFDPSLDFALVGFGVTATTGRDRRFAVVGDGLKVSFRNAPPFPVTAVTTDGDDPLPTPPSAERVDGLVFRAVASKGLR